MADVKRSRAAVLTAPEAITSTEAGRFITFLFVGGICALVNLGCVTALTLLARWAYLPAALVGTEVSVMLGFVLNDRLTFRSLASGAGGWGERCLRFHGAAAAGQALTIALGAALIHFAGLPAFIAQAIALAAMTLFNFATQRYLTYMTRR